MKAKRAKLPLAKLLGVEVGRVRFAASSLPAAVLLSPAVQAFRRDMPLAELELVDGQLPNALAELRRGRLDFALSQHMPERIDTDMHSEVLFVAPLVACARAAHPRINSLSLSDLVIDEWIGPSRRMIGQLFEPHELPAPQRITLCPSFEIAREFVQSSDAISVFALPMLAHTLERHGVRVIPVKERLPDLPVSIVTRRDAVPTPAARKLLAALRATAENQH